MTRRKQAERTLWEGTVDEDVRAFWEAWMVEADKLLEDERLIELVYAAQGARHEHSATRGRSQAPAEMALRLLLLKHIRNWSFDTLEREVKMIWRIAISPASDWGRFRMRRRWPGLHKHWAAR